MSTSMMSVLFIIWMLCTLDLSDSVSIVLTFILLLSCVLKLPLVTGKLKSVYFYGEFTSVILCIMCIQAPDKCEDEIERLKVELKSLEVRHTKQQQLIQRLMNLNQMDERSQKEDSFYDMGDKQYMGQTLYYFIKIWYSLSLCKYVVFV